MSFRRRRICIIKKQCSKSWVPDAQVHSYLKILYKLKLTSEFLNKCEENRFPHYVKKGQSPTWNKSEWQRQNLCFRVLQKKSWDYPLGISGRNSCKHFSPNFCINLHIDALRLQEHTQSITVHCSTAFTSRIFNCSVIDVRAAQGLVSF